MFNIDLVSVGEANIDVTDTGFNRQRRRKSQVGNAYVLYIEFLVVYLKDFPVRSKACN